MRKCSHCGHNGHNSRTCPQRGVKLFGVWMVAGSSHGGADIIKKSSSTGNISSSNSKISLVQSNSGSRPAGYVSDCLLHSSCNRKGVCWSEEEHRIFLMGLRAVGKGDWRAISRNFVRSRTPTQVASHAQKYFLRQTSLNKEKRRSSMFDISPETALESREGFMIQKARFSGVSSSSPDPLRWDYSAAPPAEVIRATARIFPVLEAEKGGLELGTVPPSAGANLAVNSGLSGFHMTSCDGRSRPSGPMEEGLRNCAAPKSPSKTVV